MRNESKVILDRRSIILVHFAIVEKRYLGAKNNLANGCSAHPRGNIDEFHNHFIPMYTHKPGKKMANCPSVEYQTRCAICWR